MDKGELTGLLLVDFRKAFDLVNHDLLIQKLSIYGIGNSALQWFTSYLTDRKQMVSIGRSVSDVLPVLSGVPQGSSLGPLLFILFINDISFINKDCSTHIYVDDTTLMATAPAINKVNTYLQNGADNLNLWASQNKMVIHPDKTKVLLLGTQQKLATIVQPLDVNLGGTSISLSTCEKLLGVYIDSSLTWNEHISTTIKKYNSKLEMLRRAKPILDSKNLLQLHNSLAKPTMEYCCSVWGNCSTELLDQLLLTQKRAARIILNADFSTPSLSLFKQLNFNPICDAIRYRILMQTFKILNNLSPPCLTKLLFKPVHQYSTRATANNKLSMPKARINAGKRRFSFMASSLWNNFPDSATKLTSLASFKRFTKKFFKSELKCTSELKNTRLY